MGRNTSVRASQKAGRATHVMLTLPLFVSIRCPLDTGWLASRREPSALTHLRAVGCGRTTYVYDVGGHGSKGVVCEALGVFSVSITWTSLPAWTACTRRKMCASLVYVSRVRKVVKASAGKVLCRGRIAGLL